MTLFRKLMSVVLTGVLVIAVAVALPLPTGIWRRWCAARRCAS